MIRGLGGDPTANRRCAGARGSVRRAAPSLARSLLQASADLSRSPPSGVDARARMSACSSSRNHARGTRRCWNPDQQTPYQDPGHACLLRRWHGGGAVCGGGVVTWHAVPPASPPCGSSAAVCPSSSMRGHLAPHVRVTPMIAARCAQSHLEPHQDGDGHRNPLHPLYRPRCRYLPRVSRRDGQHLHRALTRAEAQRLRSPPTMSVPSAGCRACRVRADDAALNSMPPTVRSFVGAPRAGAWRGRRRP